MMQCLSNNYLSVVTSLFPWNKRVNNAVNVNFSLGAWKQSMGESTMMKEFFYPQHSFNNAFAAPSSVINTVDSGACFIYA